MLLTGTGTAYAHHSFAATYYEDKLVTIEGELVQFDYRNPHSFVFVMVPDEKGDSAAVVDRMGRRRPAERTGRAALYAEARRQRDDHRRARPQRRRAQAADAETGASVRRIHVGRSGQLMKSISFAVAVALALLVGPAPLAAQGRGGPPPTGQAGARMDLTGYWVSVVTEDWLWRMITPPKGDVASVPLNAAGTQAAGAWDLAKDNASGDQCKAFGAAAIMRIPGTAPYHLAGREHSEDRNRCRHANAAAVFQRNRDAANRPQSPGILRGLVGNRRTSAAGEAASDRSRRAPAAV